MSDDRFVAILDGLAIRPDLDKDATAKRIQHAIALLNTKVPDISGPAKDRKRTWQKASLHLAKALVALRAIAADGHHLSEIALFNRPGPGVPIEGKWAETLAGMEWLAAAASSAVERKLAPGIKNPLRIAVVFELVWLWREIALDPSESPMLFVEMVLDAVEGVPRTAEELERLRAEVNRSFR